MARASAAPHPAGTAAPARSSEVAVVLDFVGATVPQFDRLMSRLGLEPGGPGLPGSLFQWVRRAGADIRVTQVWASRQDFEACAQDRILPTAAELRMSPPETTVYEVHSHFIQSRSVHGEEGAR